MERRIVITKKTAAFSTYGACKSRFLVDDHCPSFWVSAKYCETADSIYICISLFMSLLALRLQQ